MSALFWLLLEVKVKPLLPSNQVSVLIESDTNLTDTDPGQIYWTHQETFDCFIDSLIILLEQKGLNESPSCLVEELWAVLEEACYVIEGVGSKNEVSADQDLKDDHSNWPLVPELAFHRKMIKLRHKLCRVGGILEEALFVFDCSRAGGLYVTEH